MPFWPAGCSSFPRMRSWWCGWRTLTMPPRSTCSTSSNFWSSRSLVLRSGPMCWWSARSTNTALTGRTYWPQPSTVSGTFMARSMRGLPSSCRIPSTLGRTCTLPQTRPCWRSPHLPMPTTSTRQICPIPGDIPCPTRTGTLPRKTSGTSRGRTSSPCLWSSSNMARAPRPSAQRPWGSTSPQWREFCGPRGSIPLRGPP
mmetsp:Transcript_8000/g.22723  ORF Transcript_8000/g.22723 Transcript_8000/m.22723 type:complete len:200 (+) Transcript_8000:1429-2028(+)